ncbi:hypothetical protein [Winogradskyella helgolandensis]|uniref:hypothetical protein n=1 Tax=Winogradskyella helgolandensis TaxID=2697010 RepID=UPI0015CB3286|nr:hypothetical protein [Winogradskyella helgolandensis]
MEPSIYIAFLVFILFFLSVWFLISKFLFYPIFFKPKLNSSDTFKFLESINCSLIAYVDLSKREKKEIRSKGFRERTLFDKLISLQSEYKVIAYAIDEKKYKLFWVEIFQYYVPFYFGRRQLNFIEETNSELLNELSKNYDKNIIIVKTECPACNNKVNIEDLECNSCGLIFK